MKNLTIKRKPLLEPSIPEAYSKYKTLSYNSCNLKEVYKNEISKLNEDDLCKLKNNDCYEVFYYESHYDDSVVKQKELNFKGVSTKVIVEELSRLAEKFPSFSLQGGSLIICEDDCETEFFQINISNGQVEVLV